MAVTLSSGNNVVVILFFLLYCVLVNHAFEDGLVLAADLLCRLVDDDGDDDQVASVRDDAHRICSQTILHWLVR